MMSNEETKVMFGNRLRQLRKEKSMTQNELAGILNVTRACVTNWEIGSREPDGIVLNKLSDIFGVSIDYMLCRTSIRNYMRDLNYATDYVLDISVLNLKNKRAMMCYYAFLLQKQKKEDIKLKHSQSRNKRI